MDTGVIALVIVMFFIIILIFLKRGVEAKWWCLEHPRTNQTTDIWNISGRVNQEGVVASEPQRWPTHDGHVSVDSFVMPENAELFKKDRVPPPPYSEVDLPTYEEATAVPQPKNELASVHVVPSCSRSGQTS